MLSILFAQLGILFWRYHTDPWLRILVKLCGMNHYSHSTDGKPKSTRVKSFTPRTELSDSRGTVPALSSLKQGMWAWKRLLLSVNVWRTEECISVYWGWCLQPSIRQCRLFHLIYLKTLWAAKLIFACPPTHPLHAWHKSHVTHASWSVGTLPPCLCKSPIVTGSHCRTSSSKTIGNIF